MMGGVDYVLSRASIPAWVVCLICLAPAVWRLLRWRGQYLDPLFGIIFLLAINRLTFLIHVSAIFSHASALILALAMAYFAVWYQRRDFPSRAP